MAQRVEGLSIDLDLNTTKLDRGLAGAKDSLKSVNSEMKSNMSAFDRADKSIEKYEASLKGLNKKLKAQERVTSEARKEYDKMAKEHGEGSKEAEKAAREYNKQAAALNNLDRYVNNATEELEQMRKEQKRANSGWGKLSSGLDTFSGDLDKAGGKMTDFGQTMSASVTAPIVGMGALAVESTREFRVNMARLETNAKQAGIGIDVMRESMRELKGITGETDSNVEALSNLMATGMDDNQMQKAIDSLSGAVIKFPDTMKIESMADGLQETLATGKAIGPFAELLERMGVDLETFDEGLAKAKEEGSELNYALNTLNDLDLSKVNKEFRETNEAIIEGRNAQYDFQESFAELGEKLEPIAAELTNHVTEIIDAFNELEPATQDNIIKFAGLSAAVGPIGMALGGTTTAMANLTKGASKLTGKLGKPGGKGLLGSITGLSRGGVVGLAIGGVAALGAGIYALTRDKEELNEVSLETAEKMLDEHKATGKMIDQFDKLRSQSKLTSDEFGRYIDLQSELKDATDPKVIESIEKEMKGLQKESGLSNKELGTMVTLNSDLVETLPGATDKITDQGNKVAGTTGELEKYNEEIRKMGTLEMEKEFFKAVENQGILLQDQENQIQKINSLKNEGKQIQSLLNDYTGKELEKLEEKLKKENKSLDINKDNYHLFTTEEKKRKKRNDEILELIKDGEQGLNDQLITNKQQINEQETQLQNTKQQIAEFDVVTTRLQEHYLKNAGITEQKARQAVQDGNAIGAINTKIGKLEEEKQKLKEQTPINMRNTDEYKNAVGQIDNQIGKLNLAKGDINELTGLASDYTKELGRDVTKNANINVSPNLSAIDAALGKTVSKRVRITGVGNSLLSQRMFPGFAVGTDYHKGGPAVVGEEGPELVNQSGKWSLQSFGLMPDLSTGAQVFTHDDSMKMLKAINSLPGYASGVGTSGEADKIVNRLNGQQQSREPSPIHIEQMIVRDDNDIEKIATELYGLQEEAKREDGYS
ncbi:hypothetical protein SAMN05216232_1993 [Virgibacillus subterraneus]|uniref:Phage tail tape measure protein domain-containing protein n=1 Tax=Virgibacillus subterraneus TaxID=621109 RepID=A0A1H9EDX4_9BACI|nr:hypothetical protein [Virgibacillus subterraneus]SEQ23767.1 hypothetical protein SAMN05216232_1993 [Virgibacillus subterraneus]